LQFENQALRHQVEQLRREVRQLRPPAKTPVDPGR
jgi:hypothetical protein